MTQPAARSLAHAAWTYDILEPLPDEVQDRARALLASSGLRFYVSEVYVYGVSYIARRSPREARLYKSLCEIMPERFL